MRRVALFSVVIVGIAIILLSLPVTGSQWIKSSVSAFVAPFHESASRSVAWCSGLFSSVGETSQVAEQNRTLEAENAMLRQQLDDAHALERENAQLREHLAFKRRKGREMIMAEVVARDDISGWWRSVRISVGYADGVAANRAVVTTRGLVGKTLTPSRHACDVLLLTDPMIKVSCQLPRSGGLGIMRGMGIGLVPKGTVELMSPPQPFRLDYVAMEHEIQPGDEVVTSGLGGIYPGGLVVGYVKSVTVEPGGLYRTAAVVPAADLAAMQYVFVMVE